MEIYITNRKRCDFPFNNDLSPEDVSMSTVINVLDLARDQKDANVVLVGNEPALYPDLDKIFKEAERHNLYCVLETSGLMPDCTKQLILDKKPVITWRVYRNVFYSEQDWQEAVQNVKDFAEAGLNVNIKFICDDLSLEYSEMFKAIEILPNARIVVRTSCVEHYDPIREFLNNNFQLLDDLRLKEHRVVILDCNFSPCVFTDEMFGRAMKIGINITECIPKITILPDGRVAYCRQLFDDAEQKISQFKSVEAIVKYMYHRHGNIMGMLPGNSSCYACVTRNIGRCKGLPLYKKRIEMVQSRDILKEMMANEDPNDEEQHFKNVWNLGIALFLINDYTNAIECLEEARRLKPEISDIHERLAEAYWEADRKSEAEDEFRKASRLADNSILPLQELYKRLSENGNMIRARMLLEEIKKLAQKGN